MGREKKRKVNIRQLVGIAVVYATTLEKAIIGNVNVRYSLPISLELVVKGELLTILDWLDGEDTDPEFRSYDPFFQMTVGVARVVDETGETSLLGGVDDLVRLQRHKVKVLDSSIRVLPRALDEIRIWKYFSNVLHHK